MNEINDWVELEQNKHKLCACGCGNEIIIKSFHKKKGIPLFIVGHQSKLYFNTQFYKDKKIKTINWIKKEQSKNRICVCGCGEKIQILAAHQKSGIPKYKTGHYNKTKSNTIKPNTDIVNTWVKNEQAKHNTCKCGCGTEIIIKPRHYIHGVPKYCLNHNKIGLKHTNEAKLKMSNTRQNFSDETKLKISNKRKGIKEFEYDDEIINNWIKKHQGKHFCKCGCGLEIKIEKEHYYLGIPHSFPSPPQIHNKTGTGRPCSAETKKKLSILNTGDKNNNYGRHHSPEHIYKISGKRSANWNGGKSFEPYCHKFNNILKEHARDVGLKKMA